MQHSRQSMKNIIECNMTLKASSAPQSIRLLISYISYWQEVAVRVCQQSRYAQICSVPLLEMCKSDLMLPDTYGPLAVLKTLFYE